MRPVEQKKLNDIVEAHVNMLNNLTDYYTYTIPQKDHNGRNLNGTEVHETHPSGSFTVYDRWSFLLSSAQIIEHYLDKGFINKLLLTKKAS